MVIIILYISEIILHTLQNNA